MDPSQNHNARKRVWTVEKSVQIVNPVTGRPVARERVLVRWVATPGGKTEQRTFDSVTEARRFAVRKEDELNGLRPGVDAGGDVPLFSEWVDRYLGARYPEYAAFLRGESPKAPQQGYVATMLQAKKPFLALIGDRPLCDYRATDFERFRGLLLLEGKRAPATIEGFMQRMKVFFSAAEAEGLITKKPKIQVRKLHHEKRIFEPDQITAIFEQARNWPDEKITHESAPPGRLYPILATLYYSMMRRGELIHMTWDDLVLEDGKLVEIMVRPKEWDEPIPGAKPERRRWKPKDREVRAIPAHEALIAVLDELAKKKAHPYWVFTDQHGRRWTEAGLSSFVARFSKAIHVTVGFHKWRHSGLTHLHDAGIPIGQIQQIAGHASISTTMGYIRPSAKGRREAIKGLKSL